MKRLLVLLLAAAVLLTLFSGCAKQAGGEYHLDRVTTDGRRITPGELNLSIQFTLESDGSGSGVFNGNQRTFTWAEDDGTVTFSGSGKTLVFTKDGKDLLLHDEGTVLTFSPVEEDD